MEDSTDETPPKPKLIDTIEPIIIGPFRFIKPYKFTFRCVAKGRWENRILLDVFSQEFKHWSRQQLEERILTGDIVVNGKHITKDYKIKEHDIIEHTITRKESPVYNIPIKKLDETDKFIAFLKPPSVPIHATGGYFYNSMIKRIDNRYFPVHRLDRVTSGIIVMAKTEESAREFTQLLKNNKIHKTYLARVLGEFPEGEIKIDQPIRESKKDRSFRECGEGGKESLTIFKRLSTNGKESIVECHPITGRTHQIRVHLSYLGHPISNDPFYGGNEPTLTKEESDALKEAEKRGLWPSNTVIKGDNPASLFKIYLHSIHYQSDLFDFHSPEPDWCNLGSSDSGGLLQKCNIN
ncbi:pseudouridine synthase [Histomonas meleagridis]|uniref:pseudouridine synthase n=1 Tax=Histomonas meleagridis TaxID=135588 RepID=UPI00355A004D|nr:pseudouridine synthase [Histomonas meleagridis]KAH0797195.1 pseudouridine synthase [Histomonas meleagridis]